MSWPLGDDDRLRSQAAERLRCGQHQDRVSIDSIPWEVIDQIGLEYYRLAADIERKKLQSLAKYLVELLASTAPHAGSPPAIA